MSAQKRRPRLEQLEARLLMDADTSTGPNWSQVIITLKDDAPVPAIAAEQVMRGLGGVTGHVYEHALHGFSAQLPTASLEALKKHPLVQLVEADFAMTANAQTVPTGISRIAANTNSVAKIDGVDERVDVDIAIIDTGIAEHPDLNVVNGRRFYTSTSGPPSNRGSLQDSNYADDNGHGTHVAGTAAALDNDFGVVGVAPGARLWAVKVLNSAGTGNLSDIIAGVDWVTANADKIEVANMSLGGVGKSDAYHNAIKNSVAAGVIYVVASGNDWRDVYGDDKIYGTSDDTVPAAYPEVATISALADSDGQAGGSGDPTSWGQYGMDDAYAQFSNFSNVAVANNPVVSPGQAIDLVLPGVDILSTYPGGAYATMSGTSMASPHAAGLAALYVAANHRATDAAGVYAIRQALINNATVWNDPVAGAANTWQPDRYWESLGWADEQMLPTVQLALTTNQELNGPVTLSATASAQGGASVTKVEFFVDGKSIGVGAPSGSTWTISWNSTSVTNGSHRISAIATDDKGRMYGQGVDVQVANPDLRTPMTSSLAGSSKTISNKQWQAMVTVKVTDTSADRLLVPGAVVVGKWSDGTQVSGVTGSAGAISFTSARISNSVTSTTFTIQSITKDGYVWTATGSQTSIAVSRSGAITISSSTSVAQSNGQNDLLALLAMDVDSELRRAGKR